MERALSRNKSRARNGRGLALFTPPELYLTIRCCVEGLETVYFSASSCVCCVLDIETPTPIMSSSGTQRGTPKVRQTPAFVADSPSNIPRPKLESYTSDVGSSLSASRAKQSKRDEVSTYTVNG